MKPSWLKIKVPLGTNYLKVSGLIKGNNLHTICESGRCPNLSECWQAGTATFMILGDVCTRTCKFCNVKSGKPLPVDPTEPENIAAVVKSMNLKHCVITSVDRDDLPDGGANHWVDTISAIKNQNPETSIEALIPDFKGNTDHIALLAHSMAEVISHNLETVERLSPEIRSKAKYHQSLNLIKQIREAGKVSKSGIMLGLGEKHEEILQTMEDLIAVGCQVFTIGQYLQPSKEHHPVLEYFHPDYFAELKEIALGKGFLAVESSPFVRSSYHAEKHTPDMLLKKRT